MNSCFTLQDVSLPFYKTKIIIIIFEKFFNVYLHERTAEVRAFPKLSSPLRIVIIQNTHIILCFLSYCSVGWLNSEKKLKKVTPFFQQSTAALYSHKISGRLRASAWITFFGDSEKCSMRLHHHAFK